MKTNMWGGYGYTIYQSRPKVGPKEFKILTEEPEQEHMDRVFASHFIGEN